MPTIPTSVTALGSLTLHITVSGQALTPGVAIIPAFQAQGAWAFLGSFGGDLTGTQNQTLVTNLQGIPQQRFQTLIGGSGRFPMTVPLSLRPRFPEEMATRETGRKGFWQFLE
jgi:hypothetical protein